MATISKVTCVLITILMIIGTIICSAHSKFYVITSKVPSLPHKKNIPEVPLPPNYYDDELIECVEDCEFLYKNKEVTLCTCIAMCITLYPPTRH
ncbi:uncharacterized protein DS421_13g439570 [Arachis hypogaea]|nr:uncharacterized protein DS421_13g439570 [Arachis hypogaea]QHO04337.1 uncharacterized protein DS421_13g439570 [Arachis hypogaea]QHO04338.1 uncharacterized protein DS421_13g439570 [Arachis hypogaea]